MRYTSIVCAAVLCGATAATAIAPLACSSSATPEAADSGPLVSLGDAAFLDAPEVDASKMVVDGGFAAPEGGVIRADRFVTQVVSVTYGDCAGFGLTSMPDVVLGPPVGAGASSGGFDVVSLGYKGEIVLGFGDNAIVDGPGVDFIVFENAFYVGGDASKGIAADLAEVSVSDDGMTWTAFPCMPGASAPYGSCAGWHAVYAAPGNGISPVDPAHAGGDPYDLADLGLASARFVRIRDLGSTACATDPASKATNNGFDLDAVAIVNAKTP
ncbi:MAG: Cell surface protein [Myxococcaceae bacterium]|nr:Cell surface protein [Myxococcaceae bacterium]